MEKILGIPQTWGFDFENYLLVALWNMPKNQCSKQDNSVLRMSSY